MKGEMKIQRLFSKGSEKYKEGDFRGLLVYPSTSDVILAEKTLKGEGYKVRVVGPPPHLRTGCDLVVEFPLIEQLGIERILKEKGRVPLKVIPISDEILEPIDLCQKKDFGEYLMIRAANMKLVIDKRTEQIVNISGGGCPDVPYLADFITKAYETKGTPRFLLVKGHTDFICENGRVMKMIDEPNIEALECIGGTGDTITGMVAGLICGGHQPLDACYISAMANRIAGLLANPTPATQVMEIIRRIPEALKILRKEHFNGRQ